MLESLSYLEKLGLNSALDPGERGKMATSADNRRMATGIERPQKRGLKREPRTRLTMSLLLTVLVWGWSVPVQAELDLSPLPVQEWGVDQARHLAARAGFGASPEEIERLSQLSPRRAVASFVKAPRAEDAQDGAAKFQHSGIFEPGLDPFPPSRPATTELARRQGHALGVQVKPEGNRPLQPVVNKFFYWLRASRLETDRVAYWWAQQMLTSEQPLVEKMALFWHGHFATNEDKVRDYRKMLKQLQLFRQQGLGDFHALMTAVARDPAMLVFLDAGVNTKDSPNENFAREIMELFTMGVGEYSEQDVQEAARAFTGWNVNNLSFEVVTADHDTSSKSFLGQQGKFDGDDIIALIMAQDVTSEYIAAKLYRYFVNEDLDEAHYAQLGALLRKHELNIADYLRTLFLSRDFYRAENIGSRIKSPVELLVSTYRRLGLEEVPGVPDFNVVSGALGQRLMHPPTVAGWSRGRSWITPSLLFERGNFVLDVLFPDIGFVPPDRYPITPEVVNVQDRLRQGLSVTAATRPTGVSTTMAASNLLADRDEAFNTRLGSMRGWQMAIERVQPITRTTADVNLTSELLKLELTDAGDVIDYWQDKFFDVSLVTPVKQALTAQLVQELGTADIVAAQSYAEEGLRIVLHRMLSRPEYQLN